MNDEWFHHGFTMTYFDLVSKGDFSNPCITGIGECEMIMIENCAEEIQWLASGGMIKGIIIGFGDYLFSENERIYYTSIEPCRPITGKNFGIPGVNIPTTPELSAARTFVPVLASLTVVICYSIGKIFFNRFTGITFAALLLFHSLWMFHSRVIMSEVFHSIFSLLAILLLVYSLFGKEKIKIRYIIFSSISFGLAVSTKITILEVLPFILILLAFGITRSKISVSDFRKIFSSKSFFAVFLFLIISGSTLFITSPFYFPDPMNQVLVQIDAGKNYQAINEPFSIQKNYGVQLMTPISVLIFPVYDVYYNLLQNDEIPHSMKYGHTFTSIPLSLFFVVGIFYLIKKIITKSLTVPEFLLIFWFVSIFFALTITVDSYNKVHYFVPLIFPQILIAAYGFNTFVRNLKQKKIKIALFTISLIAHASTYLIFWERIYFEPNRIWTLPIDINFRESINDPIVQFTSVVFVVLFTSVCIIKRLNLFNSKIS